MSLLPDGFELGECLFGVPMEVGRSNVHRWVYEVADPVGDAILEIRKGLRKINPAAAEEFIRLYLDESDEDEEQS